VKFEVNPEATATVSYPPASAACDGPVGLGLVKTNNAPITTIDLGNGTTADLPTAESADVVDFTLAYTLNGAPLTGGTLTDVLPAGLDYVTGSATSNAEFSFVGYDAGSRTLTWTAANVTAGGTLTYKATVADGAADLAQPLVNVATIDSAETEPVSDDSEVYVGEVQGIVPTPTPSITPPPTDTTVSGPATGGIGFSLMLVLLGLAGLTLGLGILTPVPERARRRERDR
jgi:uncharacterized repeat protein (TIGR01451 family)